MKRHYICKSCGTTWYSQDDIFSYLQRCPECGKNTRPEKKPEVVHYAVRGQVHHALCNESIIAKSENFYLEDVTCPACLKILSDGTGLYGKCYHCRNKSSPSNKRYWRFCHADPLPVDEVDFVHGNFLNADPADKGCTSQFEYKSKWRRFIDSSLAKHSLGRERNL